MANPAHPKPKRTHHKSKHTRRPSFDPGIYLMRDSVPFELLPPFKQHIFENRFRLYRTYEKVVPKPVDKAVDDETDEACFIDFVNTICVDMRISYGFWMHLFHLYLISVFWRRVFYCPPIQATSWTWITPNTWISTIILPFPRIWATCNTRPQSFVDITAQIQLVFYAMTYVSRFVAPKLDAWMIQYGSYVVNGALTVCFWLARSGGVDRRAGWVLGGGGTSMGSSSIDNAFLRPTDAHSQEIDYSMIPGGRYGSWHAVWIPMILWLVYLVGRRNLMGIVSWEWRTRLLRQMMSCDADFADEMDAYEYISGITNDCVRERRAQERLTGPWSKWTRFWYNMERLLALFWMFVAPIMPIILWSVWIRQPSAVYPDDMPQHIPWIWTTILTTISTICLQIWYSYLNFQHQCIVWTIPYRHGFILNNFEDTIGIGIVY